MTKQTKKIFYHWTFEMATDELAACLLCGETKIEKTEKFHSMVECAKIIKFSCGHKFVCVEEDEPLDD